MSLTAKMVVATLVLGAGLACTVHAQPGLQSVLETEGLTAFGQAVKAAAEEILASDADPADQIGELIELLNSVAEYADEQVARYAMIAVMAAAAPDKMDMAEAAILGSELIMKDGILALQTVADVKSLLGGGAPGDAVATGDDEEDRTLGGGQNPLFPRSVDAVNPFAPSGKLGDDQDAPATPI